MRTTVDARQSVADPVGGEAVGARLGAGDGEEVAHIVASKGAVFQPAKLVYLEVGRGGYPAVPSCPSNALRGEELRCDVAGFRRGVPQVASDDLPAVVIDFINLEVGRFKEGNVALVPGPVAILPEVEAAELGIAIQHRTSRGLVPGQRRNSRGGQCKERALAECATGPFAQIVRFGHECVLSGSAKLDAAEMDLDPQVRGH